MVVPILFLLFWHRISPSLSPTGCQAVVPIVLRYNRQSCHKN